MKVGYVGLGHMGGAIALRLTASFPLLINDLDVQTGTTLVDEGALWCETPAELAAQCDVVFLCLPTSEHVRAVIFGSDGLLEGAVRGLVIIDQSTGDPNATQRMARDLSPYGVELIDAPVSGGSQGAEAGTLAIMVGATRNQFERILPVLNAISPNVFHAGDVGTGNVIKLVNNLLSGVQRLLAFEGMALAVKNGVEADTALGILLAGGGSNAYLQRIMGQQVLSGKLNPGFTLGLQHKDLRLACQLGIESKVPMFLGSYAREFYQMCINEMGAEAQVDTAARIVDRLADTNVVPATEDRP